MLGFVQIKKHYFCRFLVSISLCKVLGKNICPAYIFKKPQHLVHKISWLIFLCFPFPCSLLQRAVLFWCSSVGPFHPKTLLFDTYLQMQERTSGGRQMKYLLNIFLIKPLTHALVTFFRWWRTCIEKIKLKLQFSVLIYSNVCEAEADKKKTF